MRKLTEKEYDTKVNMLCGLPNRNTQLNYLYDLVRIGIIFSDFEALLFYVDE